MTIVSVDDRNGLYGKVTNNILVVDNMIKYNFIIRKYFSNGFTFRMGGNDYTTGIVEGWCNEYPNFTVTVICSQNYVPLIESIKNRATYPLHLIYYGSCRDTSGWNAALPRNPQGSVLLNQLLTNILQRALTTYKPLEITNVQPHPIMNTIKSASCYVDTHPFSPPLGLESTIALACIQTLGRHQRLVEAPPFK